MQVNSAQDYLTMKKRQIIASTFHSIPAPQSRRTNASFLSAMANRATQTQILVVPEVSAWGDARGGKTTSNWCCLSNGNTSAAPGALARTIDSGIVRFNVIPPMSVTASRPNGRA
jgi:hypothetical protein